MDGITMGNKLAAGGYNVGVVQELTVISPRGVSGRMLKVIDSTHGGITVRGTTSTARISGGTFQSLLGLKSTFISHSITGRIRNKWDLTSCGPGLPNAEPYTWKDLSGASRGSAQDFASGRIFYNSSNDSVFWIYGPILGSYDDQRKRGVDFGMPLSDVYSISGGTRADFEHGYITWSSATGHTTVIVYH
jgi:uncharacterized protein with LGFP repeats